MTGKMFDTQELIPDSFSCQFGQGVEAEQDFKRALQEFDYAAKWVSMKVKDISIGATACFDAERLHGGAAAVNDGSYLIIKKLRSKDMPYVLRPWACRSLQVLCQDVPGIGPKILAAGRPDVMAKRLNEDLKFLPQNKNFLALVRGEKVGAIFGDFNSTWSQSEQVAALKGKLQDMFGDHEFLSGYIDHIETRAEYQLGPSLTNAKFLKTAYKTAGEAVLAPYLKIWTNAGMKASVLMDAIPTLEFRTGESGLAQLMLVPKIRCQASGVDMLLSSPLKVKHRGSDDVVWGAYVGYLSSVVSEYQNGIRGIVDLTQRKIVHPYSCLSHLLKNMRASTPVVEARNTLEAFALIYPYGKLTTCTAYTLYEVINDMNQRTAAVTSVTKQIQNMEFTAQMLSPKFNWKRFDVATPAVFSAGKVILDDNSKEEEV